MKLEADVTYLDRWQTDRDPEENPVLSLLVGVLADTRLRKLVHIITTLLGQERPPQAFPHPHFLPGHGLII